MYNLLHLTLLIVNAVDQLGDALAEMYLLVLLRILYQLNLY